MHRFHPLAVTFNKPERLNCPFCYEPHPLARKAAEQVMRLLPEMAEGKMFGVLVVENDAGGTGFLAAYSGHADFLASAVALQDDYFVPPVFDYLAPDGYFKTHEAEITRINHLISDKETSEEYLALKETLQAKNGEFIEVLSHLRQSMAEAKRSRDERRQSRTLTESEAQALIKESQFQKAELHRTKKRWQKELAELQARVDALDAELDGLRKERKTKSDALQRWLFTEFRIADSHGEWRSLASIFADAIGHLPPSGAGECCEPKLLHYAFTHALRPVAMAMFWWGESPVGEVRRSRHYYPACQGKCKPLLDWMLRDYPVDSNPLEEVTVRSLEMVYEDDAIAVVSKPEGLLTVPGRCNMPSVYSVLRRIWPNIDSPIIVHRLDMDTSGLMVVAKTREAHRLLQKQFELRQTEKVYIALLEHPLDSRSGTIDLPLRRNDADSPRQMVDRENGKPSLTTYYIIGETDGHPRIELHPKTGRTHQLRMHCAHREGLDDPILGDRLYGRLDRRLYLHAMRLAFTHPVTGERMTFERQPDF